MVRVNVEVIANCGGKLTLRRLPSSGCGPCSADEARATGCCGAAGWFNWHREVTFATRTRVPVGEKVELVADPRSILTAVVRLYGWPLGGMLVGGVLGQLLELGELWTTLAIFGAGVSGFGVARLGSGAAPAIEVLFSPQLLQGPDA